MKKLIGLFILMALLSGCGGDQNVTVSGGGGGGGTATSGTDNSSETTS